MKRYPAVGMEMMRAVAMITLGFVTACTRHNPAATCPNGVCSDPHYPFCDSDGAIGGVPGDCIAVSCTPGELVACDGSNAISCDNQGSNYVVTPCSAGCDNATGCNECTPGTVACGTGVVQQCSQSGKWSTLETCQLACVEGPTPHCAYLQPRYVPDVCDSPATTDLDFTSSGNFDADLDINCNGGVIDQSAGPQLCVVHYRTITIEAGQTLRAMATNVNRAIVLVADGDLQILGTLDISAAQLASGPGGGFVMNGMGALNGGGGGGAGFRTAGASGGTTATDGGANDAGAVTMDPALLTYLAGGPASGGGSGGGGAAALISCRGTVTVTGSLISGGGGGLGGQMGLGVSIGGGGGGAGGYFVLEGLDVHVTGSVFANGGGGGAGMQSNGQTGNPGLDGTVGTDTSAASGGTALGGGGRGGAGGFANGFPGIGGHVTTAGATAGGGGGSMGFMQSYTPMGVTPTLNPTHASPPFQPNGTVPTR